jgi:hypothetical protein
MSVKLLIDSPIKPRDRLCGLCDLCIGFKTGKVRLPACLKAEALAAAYVGLREAICRLGNIQDDCVDAALARIEKLEGK